MKALYGPLSSKRLGRSLGIDIVPYKVCSLDCIYCQLGKTTEISLERRSFFSPTEILDELKEKLSLSSQIDWLSFSGSGEPTLNSHIGDIISKIKEITSIPVCVITNGTLLDQREVRQDLFKADLVLPSLDTSRQESFRNINLPHPDLEISRIIEGLITFRDQYPGKIWLEIMLVKGVNNLQGELEALKKAAEKIRPDKVQLNTVTRPAQNPEVSPISFEELQRLKDFFGPGTEVIGIGKDQFCHKKDIENMILQMIKGNEDLQKIAEITELHPNEISRYMAKLLGEGRIICDDINPYNIRKDKTKK